MAVERSFRDCRFRGNWYRFINFSDSRFDLSSYQLSTNSVRAREKGIKLSSSPSSQRKVGKGASKSGTSRRLWKAKKVVKKMVLGSDIVL
jgi:hypothetical protein